MVSTNKIFEGARRLSIAMSLLWVLACFTPIALSAKETWNDYQAKLFLRQSFWKFAEKETDKTDPWTVVRYENAWDEVGTTIEESPNANPLRTELHLHPPKDNLQTDIKDLRLRSWKSLYEKAQEPLTLAIFGVVVVFAFRKTAGWVARGFLD